MIRWLALVTACMCGHYIPMLFNYTAAGPFFYAINGAISLAVGLLAITSRASAWLLVALIELAAIVCNYAAWRGYETGGMALAYVNYPANLEALWYAELAALAFGGVCGLVGLGKRMDGWAFNCNRGRRIGRPYLAVRV